MSSFPNNGSLSRFQAFINDIYGLPDDRMFSIFDLLSNMERFTMRAIKGIRKGDPEKTRINLLISFSWCMAIANRLHIDLESIIWERFPDACSYCGSEPCACKSTKNTERVSLNPDPDKKPISLSAFQDMFERIYPSADRTLNSAGVHLAEETGEVCEAISVFLGEHKPDQFKAIAEELADYTSCLFGVANSLPFSLADTLAEHYTDNCHACHNAPCTCGFSYIAKFDS